MIRKLQKFLDPIALYRVRTFNFACMRRGDEIFSFLAKLTAFSQQLSGKLTISACLLIILLLVLDNCWNNLLLLYFPLLTRNAGEIFPSICMVKFRLLLFIFRWLKRNWISISVSLFEMFSPSGFKISWFSCWKWTYLLEEKFNSFLIDITNLWIKLYAVWKLRQTNFNI